MTKPAHNTQEPFETKNAQSVGRSAPGVFTTQSFDFQLMRWLSQTTYSGAEIGECFSTAHLIEDGSTESWLHQWSKTARRVEQIGLDCLDRGHCVSAREAFLRATTYYEAAFFYAASNDARKRELYLKHRECFQRAGALFASPFEAVLIPYEGRTLPGYFMRPEMLKKMTLWGLEDKITIPLLNMSSTGEGKLMHDNAKAFYGKLPNPRNRFVLTNEDQGAELHTQRGNSSLLHQLEFDWLDEVFTS